MSQLMTQKAALDMLCLACTTLITDGKIVPGSKLARTLSRLRKCWARFATTLSRTKPPYRTAADRVDVISWSGEKVRKQTGPILSPSNEKEPPGNPATIGQSGDLADSQVLRRLLAAVRDDFIANLGTLGEPTKTSLLDR